MKKCKCYVMLLKAGVVFNVCNNLSRKQFAPYDDDSTTFMQKFASKMIDC